MTTLGSQVAFANTTEFGPVLVTRRIPTTTRVDDVGMVEFNLNADAVTFGPCAARWVIAALRSVVGGRPVIAVPPGEPVVFSDETIPGTPGYVARRRLDRVVVTRVSPNKLLLDLADADALALATALDNVLPPEVLP